MQNRLLFKIDSDGIWLYQFLIIAYLFTLSENFPMWEEQGHFLADSNNHLQIKCIHIIKYTM